MTRRFVNQLANGDTIDEVFLVADKQLRANRQGNLYLHLELRDKSGTVGARLWNASEGLARTFEPGDFLHVRGKIQVFQGALQVILSHIEGVASDQIEPEDFLRRSSQNVAPLTARLRGELLFGLQNRHLRALAECFLIDEPFVQRFTTPLRPGSRTITRTRQGCSVVVTMLNVADKISESLPRTSTVTCCSWESSSTTSAKSPS